MKVMITAATAMELEALQVKAKRFDHTPQLQLMYVTTGVGLVATTYTIIEEIIQHQPDVILQIGIAGSFDHLMQLGTTVAVKNEIFGDLGVEENGEWKDVFDMKFAEPSAFPFALKKLENPFLKNFNIEQVPLVSAISVNEITTQPERIEMLKKKYGCAIESMEGAAFHYVCLQKQLPFLQIRAISNYVGERNKSKWKIKEALENLAETVVSIIDNLTAKKVNNN